MGRKTNEVKAKERFFRILLSAGFTDITKNFYKEKGYSEEVLANYSKLIKRAFQKGKYITLIPQHYNLTLFISS